MTKGRRSTTYSSPISRCLNITYSMARIIVYVINKLPPPEQQVTSFTHKHTNTHTHKDTLNSTHSFQTAYMNSIWSVKWKGENSKAAAHGCITKYESYHCNTYVWHQNKAILFCKNEFVLSKINKNKNSTIIWKVCDTLVDHFRIQLVWYI